jgi:TldD protein
MRDLLREALSVASSNGASYADARYRETRTESVYTMNNVLRHYGSDNDSGIGIRVLVDGHWGFSAIMDISRENIVNAAKMAVRIAKSSATIKQNKISLTEDIPLTGFFSSPCKIDPFSVPLSDKVGLLYGVHDIVSKNPLVKKTDGNIYIRRFRQIMLSTEGADLENEVTTTAGSYTVTVVDKGDFQTRSYQDYPKASGWEWILEQPFIEKAEVIAEQAVEKLRAPKSPSGNIDLILLPSHLVLTIHESVGHPTELDRVLGWEANFAGTSFATTEKRGVFQYGSPLVNFRADNTLLGGLATLGWDDDGIPGKSWDIVKDGILVNYGTTRETADYSG